MKELKEKILKEGKVCPSNIVKVDSFLNHQLDIAFLRKIGEEFYNRFKNNKVDKVLTIESSGIAIACFVAEYFNCRVVFAKKGETANCTDDKYISQAYSFTHKKMNSVFVSKPYMLADDKVLIVDDFLADGQAMSALIDIVHQAGATVVGCGVAIEKGVQEGGKKLRSQGYHVESIAIVEEMDYEKGTVSFRK